MTAENKVLCKHCGRGIPPISEGEEICIHVRDELSRKFDMLLESIEFDSCGFPHAYRICGLIPKKDAI